MIFAIDMVFRVLKLFASNISCALRTRGLGLSSSAFDGICRKRRACYPEVLDCQEHEARSILLHKVSINSYRT